MTGRVGLPGFATWGPGPTWLSIIRLIGAHHQALEGNTKASL
jgi:hypothetical protein